MELPILSAGAAKGLVTALADAFLADTGAAVKGAFGAVGAMKERIKSGEPCDVVILTAAMIAGLEKDDEIIDLNRIALEIVGVFQRIILIGMICFGFRRGN